MNSRVTTKNFTFGAFQLDTTHRLLTCAGGEAVPLTPKTFELLLLLVASEGRLLTKAELMNKMWPDSFVEEGNLTQTVSVLRKALGDNPHQHSYIVTVPGQGYRFVAEVHEAEQRGDEFFIESDDDLTQPGPNQNADEAEKPDLRGSESALYLPHPRSGPKVLLKLDDREDETRQSEPHLPTATFAPSDWGRNRVIVAAGLCVVVLLGLYWLTRTAEPPKSVTEVKSIAILPFKNIGGQADQEYLGQGLAEVLITKLSNLKTIVVRPTNAVLKYADASPDPKKFGSDLNVEAVIMGRVQKVDENIRVTVQLVRVSDGATLWAATFDDKFTNIFAVQDSISAQVVSSLAITLTSGERQQFAKRDTANSEAFQLYLQGRHFWNKRTGESLQKAIGYFEQATQKDPYYALAYTGLANCYQLLAEYSVTTPREGFPKAKAAANKALEIDGQLAEAHNALAYTQAFYDWDWAGAEQSFQRALALNPNYASAHQWYAEYLVVLGRFDEARAHFARALEIDPVSPIILTDLAALYDFQGDYDKECESRVELEQKEGEGQFPVAMHH